MSKEIIMAEGNVPIEISGGGVATLEPPKTGELTEGQQAVAAAENILRGTGLMRDFSPAAPTTPPTEGVQPTAGGPPADQGGEDRGGGRDEGGGDRGEGPPGPEGGLEHEASPERGREIAEEIVYWEALRVAGRYQEVNWPRLNQLFREQEVHIEALRRVSLDVKPYWGRPEQPTQQIPLEIQTINPDRVIGFRPLEEWVNEYRTGAVTDRDRFIREVNVYFAEAKRVGLLGDLDALLVDAYTRQVKTGIARKFTSVDVMFGNPRAGIFGVDERIQRALNSLTGVYRDRQWTDPAINRLAGVGELYAQFATERFIAAINNRDLEGSTQRPYLIDNEFHLEEVGEVVEEKYWHLEHGYYVYVDAQTPAEYQRAADSYISRLESITTSPAELLQEAKYFVQAVLRSEGFERVNKEFPGFITELVYQIEGRIGVFGADNSNELYRSDEYKQYMDYINKDGKGPQRWLALTKLLEGQVAATLWALDRDPRWEILFSLFGSRGQLAKASEAQRNSVGTQGLFAQARDLLIEEMMGVVIKDKRDLENLTTWMPDRQFVSMFEGLFRYGKVPQGRSQGDANIRVYEQFKDVDDRQLIPDQRRAKRLGRIQKALREGKKLEELDPSDREFYQQAWDTAKKAFDIAFQMYGALGEKSKRAGGVFKTDFKNDSEGKKYRYFVPVHLAEKWVQCAETLTKIQYAHLPAKERAAKVKQARDRNIAIFKKDGFEAMMVDADGRPMKLKRPKEDLNTPDELARDPSGNVMVEEVPVDFYTATHHPYGDWTGHTYWSYQEEDRHLILNPVAFAEARKIRDGQLRPEDASPWAVQLLILDPTLRRVRRFEENFEERERKLTMAAVEDSYQSHWRIGRELYRAFFPKYGTPTEDIGIYYGLQDYGGFRKMIEHARSRAAEDPERFTRRGRRLIPYLHIPASALSEYLGVGSVGALGVIRMLGAPIYRMCGTLALDKFSAQAEIANKQYEALFIATKDNEGNIVEPLLLKLTNESDTNLQPFFLKLPKIGQWWKNPADQQEFCVATRKSFGRLERYEKLISTIDTFIRNASGALWLEEVDVLTDNGELDQEVERRFSALPDISKKDLTKDDLARFITEAEELASVTEEEFNRKFNSGVDDENPGIDEGSISIFTGSGRHSARIFHDAFFEVFLDEGKRGGYRLYPTERFLYKHLRDKIIYYHPAEAGSVAERDEDIRDWLFIKFVPV